MNSTNMISNAPAPSSAKPVILEAKLAEPMCCFVHNPNPCAAIQELFKTAVHGHGDNRKLCAVLHAGEDLKKELTDFAFAKLIEEVPRPKKRVRFSETPPRIQHLHYETKENLNPKEVQPNHKDDVCLNDAKFNRWSDDPRESRLYSLNCRLNQIDPKVVDSEELRKNMPAISVAVVEEARIRNWHAKGPKPLRFLVAVILTTEDIPGNLRKLSKQVVIKLKKMIDDLAAELESGKKDFCHMYEYGVTVTKVHMGRLKARSKVIEKYLLTLE